MCVEQSHAHIFKPKLAVFALKQTAAVTETAEASEQVSSEPVETVSTVLGAGMDRAGSFTMVESFVVVALNPRLSDS